MSQGEHKTGHYVLELKNTSKQTSKPNLKPQSHYKNFLYALF